MAGWQIVLMGAGAWFVLCSLGLAWLNRTPRTDDDPPIGQYDPYLAEQVRRAMNAETYGTWE